MPLIGIQEVVYTVGMLSVIANGVSGALAAGRKRFDWVGVAVIAMVTALGGGTLRDLLLDRRPIFWIGDLNYVYATLGATALAMIYVRFFAPPIRMLLIADAVGLALFTVSGTQIADGLGVHPVVAVLMGAVTGAAGGVLRDVLSGEAPLLFREGELYATASIAGAIAYLLLDRTGAATGIATAIGILVVIAIRMAAMLWKIKLPVFDVPEEKR